MNAAPPYAALTPDVILDAVEHAGFRTDGRMLALNSYENRVYQIGLDEGAPLIAKFYRPGRWSDAAILEEHGFARELAALEIPVVPPIEVRGATLHHVGGFRFSLSHRRGGRAPELDRPEVLEWIGRFLGRIHAQGSAGAFVHRPTLTLERFAAAPREWLLNGAFIPADIRPAWERITALAIDGARAAFERAGPVRAIRLHGDCHAGNVLFTDKGPHFVDFDDCLTGPAIQDLWMMLSGTRAEMTRQLADLLAGYGDFAELDPRELHLVEALRTLRLIHYSFWIAQRWTDPAFPLAFPWFNTQRYWQDRILEMREQVAAMEEEPLPI
jgi:Ser/Thr protein kinase RdoA (MazF antagonist)